MADAAHLAEHLDVRETAVVDAPLHDALREDGADAGQRLQLGRGRCVEIDEHVRGIATRLASGSRAG